jgi:GNAT superfamily N-acetyltransferase
MSANIAISIVRSGSLGPEQKEVILRLWNDEYPSQLFYQSMTELEAYLSNLNNASHYFAIGEECAIGWAFSFVREQEIWFAIIVDSRCHKNGIGTLLLDALKQDNEVLNGWVTDHDRYMKTSGARYWSPLVFYRKNSFEVLHNTRLEIEKLSAVKIRWQRGR